MQYILNKPHTVPKDWEVVILKTIYDPWHYRPMGPIFAPKKLVSNLIKDNIHAIIAQ